LDYSDPRRTVAILDSPEQKQPGPRRVTYQKHLFDPQVVELPMPSSPSSRGASRSRSASRGSARRYHPAQQAFDFDQPSWMDRQSASAHPVAPSEAAPQEFTPHIQDTIYCDSPVAQPIHRLMAAALDSSMIVIALGLFLLTFHICGGSVVLNAKTAVLYLGIYAVIWFFYRALFGICGADTPGMLWTDLRLVNFEGETPDREQRIYRMFGGVLGFLSAGLGLVWSLVDEEHLTWHDHISKTFPSPTRT
jgi:uncharacterized RDD family membrane protein YckC